MQAPRSLTWKVLYMYMCVKNTYVTGKSEFSELRLKKLKYEFINLVISYMNYVAFSNLLIIYLPKLVKKYQETTVKSAKLALGYC